MKCSPGPHRSCRHPGELWRTELMGQELDPTGLGRTFSSQEQPQHLSFLLGCCAQLGDGCAVGKDPLPLPWSLEDQEPGNQGLSSYAQSALITQTSSVQACMCGQSPLFLPRETTTGALALFSSSLCSRTDPGGSEGGPSSSWKSKQIILLVATMSWLLNLSTSSLLLYLNINVPQPGYTRHNPLSLGPRHSDSVSGFDARAFEVSSLSLYFILWGSSLDSSRIWGSFFTFPWSFHHWLL